MNHRSSRSSLFLMELILVILFFSLASAVCVQMFVRSHVLSSTSVELNNAVVWCESMAEAFYAFDGDLSGMEKALEGAECDASSSIKVDHGEYSVTGVLEKEGELLRLDISCYDKKDDEIIYSLSPKLYPKESGDSNE